MEDNANFGESIRNFPSTPGAFLNYLSFTILPFPLNDISLWLSPQNPTKESEMISQFLTGQPMDYQRISSTLTDDDGNTLIDRNYINFGNFNYGVVAAAAGYTYEQALLGAATLNILHAITHSNINTSGTYFGNSRNQYFINMGYQAYTSGKIKGTE